MSTVLEVQSDGKIYWVKGCPEKPKLDNLPFSMKSVEGSTKLEATFKAVIDFIKWYNSQQHGK